MNVSNLRQFLSDLARLMGEGGAKSPAADMNAVVAGLTPFADQPLQRFADFLVRAEAYSRGEVPVAKPKRSATPGGGRTKAAKPPKPPSPDVEAIARQTQEMYEGAAGAAVTREGVEALAGALAGLKKEDLVRVAERIEMVGMKAKKKELIVVAIRDRILARKGATQRVILIDRRDKTDQAPADEAEPQVATPGALPY